MRLLTLLVLAACGRDVALEGVESPEETCPMAVVDRWLLLDDEVLGGFGLEDVCIKLELDGQIAAHVDGATYRDGLPQWACEDAHTIRVLDYGLATVDEAGPELWYVEVETWWGKQAQGYVEPCPSSS